MTKARDDARGGAPTGVPPRLDLSERLENEVAALAVLVRLAVYGRDCCSRFHAGFGTPAERISGFHEATVVARMFDNGSGGYEADAVVHWAMERLRETENTLAAITGGGPPFDPAAGFEWLREKIEAVRLSHDLTESHHTLLDAAAAVLSVSVDGNQRGDE